MDDFAALLLAARERTGLTQAQVAVAAGLTPSYLSFLENRKKPPPSDEVCQRLAAVLGVPARRLIEVAHLERAPPTVRQRLSSLTRSLKRERKSRRRVLESLLSPFLFRGPPGYVESALDAIGISAKRRKRMREALRAVGRRRQDLAGEVARIVEDLPEKDRQVLLAALPRLLSEAGGTAPAGKASAADPPGRPSGAPDAGANAGADAGAGADLPLFYTLPPPGEAPQRRFLLEVTAGAAAAGPPDPALHEGDRLVVDPNLEPAPGDLVVLHGPESARVRRLEAVGRRFRLVGRPDGGGGAANPEPLAARELAARLRRDGAGTVVEVRRPLRRGGGPA